MSDHRSAQAGLSIAFLGRFPQDYVQVRDPRLCHPLVTVIAWLHRLTPHGMCCKYNCSYTSTHRCIGRPEGQFRRRFGLNSVGDGCRKANELPGDGSGGTSGGNAAVIGRERRGGEGTSGGERWHFIVLMHTLDISNLETFQNQLIAALA